MRTDQTLYDEKDEDYHQDSDTRSYLSDCSRPTFDMDEHDGYKETARAVKTKYWKNDLTLSPSTSSREGPSDATNFSENSRKHSNYQFAGPGSGFYMSSTVLREGREQEFMKQSYTAPSNSCRSSRTLFGLKHVSDVPPIDFENSYSDDAQTRCSDATTLN